MPQFYFHLRTPAGLEQDESGLELAGVEVAYLEACHTVPALSCELAREGANPSRYAFEIADATGALLMEVPFFEVLERGRKPISPQMAASFRRAATTMERTANLISSIGEEQATLRATLTETKRLLAEALQACQPQS